MQDENLLCFQCEHVRKKHQLSCTPLDHCHLSVLPPSSNNSDPGVMMLCMSWPPQSTSDCHLIEGGRVIKLFCPNQ